MTERKILVVEDDVEIREIIKLYLVKNDYRVVMADNGEDAVKLAASEQPDLIILDVLLPGKDGFEVCREIRSTSSAPILFLSGKKEESDKIAGLNMGGDDFITKPFSPNELIARVRANLRRPQLAGSEKELRPSKLSAGAIQIDLLSRAVKINGQEIALSRKEFELLCFLASRPDQTFTHEQLFREIWGQECLGDTRTIIVHVSNLRKKIEPDPSNPHYIINIHGVGYKFVNRSRK